MTRKKAAGIHHIQHEATTIPFALLYSKRKTLTIRIHPDCTVTVDAPTGTPLERVRDIVQHKTGWIVRKLRDIQANARPIAPTHHYLNGEVFRYLGRPLSLKIEVGAVTRVMLVGDFLTVTTPTPEDAERVGGLVRGWYRRQAERIFAERMAVCQPQATALGIPDPQKFTIRLMKTRWGSCSGGGRITLNLRLIQVDTDLIDYVVLHELCHLRELNHSPRFYALMTRILPDWKPKRQALNQSPVTW